MSKLFDKAISQVSEDTKRFVDNTIDVVDQIDDYLSIKNMTRRELAEKLDKKESEISKWMTGTHNFTLRSISKIEAALNETIITTPQKVNKEYFGKTLIVYAKTNRLGYQSEDYSLNIAWKKPKRIQKEVLKSA